MPLRRLAALVPVLLAVIAAGLLLPHSPSQLRDLVLAAGVAAPAIVLAAWVVLTPALFPGPVLAASGGLGVFGMTVGGQMLGLSADTVAVLHLYVIGSFSLAGAAFERPLVLVAAVYFLAFFLVARWPAVYIPISLITHALLAVITIGIFWPKSGRPAR